MNLSKQDEEFCKKTDDEQVAEILAWIKSEKAKGSYASHAGIKQAFEDIRKIKDDWRVTSHGEGMFYQKRNYIDP